MPQEGDGGGMPFARLDATTIAGGRGSSTVVHVINCNENCALRAVKPLMAPLALICR